MHEASELTEMAGVAEADTEMAYAWGALDYDDVDDFPTQRLTPRRITALSLAASLVVIAMAGGVALGVLHNANQPVAQAPSSPVVETVARPVPPPPSTPSPPPQPPRVPQAREENFVAALRAAPSAASWQNISWVMIPGGSADTRNDDALLLTHGYEACAVMDRYPGDRHGHDAAWAFYSEQGFRMEFIASFPEYDQEMSSYLNLADSYLCQNNAATSPPVVQAAPPPPPPPATTVEPSPVQAGCVERSTKYSPASEIPYTCENGQWHKGPYGYLQGGGG